jgi:PAS domain S-box-containing protein
MTISDLIRLPFVASTRKMPPLSNNTQALPLPTQALGRRLIAGLVCIAALLAVIIMINELDENRFENATRLANEASEFQRELSAILGNMVDIESGSQGYLLTGQPSFLDSYHAGTSQIGAAIERLISRVDDNSSQNMRVSRLRELIESQLIFRAGLVRAVQVQGVEAARRTIDLRSGKAGMDTIRAMIGDLVEEELREVRVGQQSAEKFHRNSVYTVSTLRGLILIILVIGVFGVRVHLRLRLRLEQQMQDRAVDLERQVRVRTAQIAAGRDFSDAIIDSLPGLFGVLNEDGKVLRWNESVSEELGYSEKELKSMHPAKLFVDPSKFSDILRACFERGKYSDRIELLTKEGEHKVYRFRAHVAVLAGERRLIGQGIDVTDRIKALHSLETERALHLRILDTLSEGVNLIDRNGCYVFNNAGAEKLLGMSRDQWQGLHYSKVLRTRRTLDGTPFPLEQHPFVRLQNGEERLDGIEYEIEHLDGKRVVVSINGRALKNADGEFDGVVHTVTDITQRQAAEAALLERTHQLSLFIEESPVALAMLDCDMRYVAVSRRWATDFRLTGAPLIGRHHDEVYPNTSQRWKDVYQRCLAGAVERSDEDPFVRADGSTGWVRWEMRPWRTTRGKIGGIVIFSEDISARKRTETALRESEARLRLALDCANMATFEWDMLNDSIVWSQGHEELFGFAPGEFAGNYAALERRIFAQDAAGVNAEIARCITNRSDFNWEFRVVWPDGSTRWIVSQGRFEFGEGGRPLGLCGVVLESTERRENLEWVAALSRRLLQVQEEERRRLAHELHDELGQVLTVVRLELKALECNVKTGTGRRAIQNSLSAVERAIAQVRSLSLDLRPPLLGELGILAALRGLAERQPIAVELIFSPPDLSVPEEVATVCYRVAQEALTNVARHARTSNARLLVQANGESITVRIEDKGAGFDAAAVRDKERFGLAGMRERVQLVGGIFTLHSSPGKGCEVRAELPLKMPA